MEERAALLTRVSADSGTEIKDPATGEAIGRVAFGTPGDVAAAVGTAVAAQPGWAALSDEERCDALMRAADAIDAHAEELAYVVSREQGKTMNGLGARYEAAGCAAWVRATAGTPLPAEVLVDEPANHAELHYGRSAWSASTPGFPSAAPSTRGTASSSASRASRPCPFPRSSAADAADAARPGCYQVCSLARTRISLTATRRSRVTM